MVIAGIARAGDPGAPPAAQQAVTDTYHGVRVSDPYRWLENPNSKQVREWSTAEDQRTRKYLDTLPQRGPIYDQLLKQISATSSSYHGLHAVGEHIFALYEEPPKQQAMVAVHGVIEGPQVDVGIAASDAVGQHFVQIEVARGDSAEGWESSFGIAPRIHAVQHNRLGGRGGKGAARPPVQAAAAQLLRRPPAGLAIVGPCQSRRIWRRWRAATSIYGRIRPRRWPAMPN